MKSILNKLGKTEAFGTVLAIATALSIAPELQIKNILFSDEFCDKYKRAKKDFIRKRKLPFAHLVLDLLHLGEVSMKRELDKRHLLIK